jgi:enoyl-CoA hydratase
MNQKESKKMSFSTILYERDGPVAMITLNRPDVRNAQNEQMKDEIDEALSKSDIDEKVRVIVLRSSGPSFSAGHDMKQLPRDPVSFGATEGEKWTDGDSEKVRQFVYKIFRQFLKIRDVRKPTIAQVQGHCIAAGWVLASMCDLIVASKDAQFSDPVLRTGSTGMQVLVEPWDIGFRQAKHLLWTGGAISASEALRLGLVNRVVPLEDLEKETMQLANKIALTPFGTLQATKRSINRTQDLMGWRLAQEQHIETWLVSQFSNEHKELHAGQADMGVKEFIRRRDQAYK